MKIVITKLLNPCNIESHSICLLFTGTASLTIRALKNKAGYCLDPLSKSHAIELQLTSALSTGIALQKIMASSLRLDGMPISTTFRV